MPIEDDLTKWISRRAKFGKEQMYYHTVQNCKYFKKAKKTREAIESELVWHEAEECDECKRLRSEEEDE